MTARPVFFVLFLWMVWMLQLGGSCASDSSVSYREHEYVDPPPREVYVEPPPRRVYTEAPPDRVYVQPPPPERVYVEPPPPDRVYVERPREVRVYEDLPPRIPRGSYRVEDKEGKIRWIAEDDGTYSGYCVYEADDPEVLRRHADALMLPTDAIKPVVATLVLAPDPEPAAAR